MLEYLNRAFPWLISAGIVVILQPWWAHGLRVGFFLTLAATLGYIVTSHLQPAGEP